MEMANEAEADQNGVLRGILESMVSGELARGGGSTENVAQLLAAAIAQVGQNMITAQNAPNDDDQPPASEEADTDTDFGINPQVSDSLQQELYITEEDLDDAGVVTTVEIPTSHKPKPICVKFPIELRKQIIAMRKEGKKCKDIAKELRISVSGAQKVWERFLATGMVHDRKPSSYAGRPRKYTYSQDSPVSPGYETQFLGDGSVGAVQNKVEEYAPTSSSTMSKAAPLSDATANTVVITAEDSEVFTTGPLDAPGAMVEIVDTEPLTSSTPGGRKQTKKSTPVYREQLLFRLIEACPLATLREMPGAESNPHVQNISVSVNKPLYMEYVLGHPFGKVPAPRPFDTNPVESQVILSDPSNPVGKELLAALGYTTKVYFNACCKPSPLFDQQKIPTHLPISIGPGHLTETMRTVLQLLLDLCQDPLAALERIPSGPGPALIAHNADREIKSQGFPPPTKLSDYWSQLYKCASQLECCENFLSATTPSVPCLLCHPFETFVQRLEIKDPPADSATNLPSPPLHHSDATSVKPQLQRQDYCAPVQSPSSTIATSHLKHSKDQLRKLSSEAGQSNISHLDMGLPESSQPDPTTAPPIPQTHPSCPPNSAVFSSSPEIHLVRSLAEAPSQLRLTQPGEKLQLSAHHVERHGGSTTQGILPTIQDVTSEPGGSMQGSNQRLGGRKEGVRRSVNVAVKLDHPYSGSSWKKHDNEEERAEEERSGDESPEQQQEEERGEESSVSDSPQILRRSRRKAAQMIKSPRVSANTPATEGKSTSPMKTRSSNRSGSRGRPKRTVPTKYTSEGEDLSSSPPPAKRTRNLAQISLAQMEDYGGGVEKPPLEWGVEEVADFISSIPHCNCMEVFKEHEVDGESLLSLNPERMVKLMDLKTGPALRIYNKITALKQQFGIHPL